MPTFDVQMTVRDRRNSAIALRAVAYRLEEMPDSMAAWAEAFRLARENDALASPNDVVEATCREVEAEDSPEALARDAARFRTLARALDRQRIIFEIHDRSGAGISSGAEVFSTSWRFAEIADRWVDFYRRYDEGTRGL